MKMEEWKYKRLSECLNFVSERTSDITIDNYISTENMIENRGGVKTASTLTTIGQLGINKMKATCNQACCVLRPKKNKAFGIFYLFHFFKENREFIIGLGNGAAQQNLSQVLINKLKIVNPNKKMLEIFEEKESMFFEKIYHLQQQISYLTQQRDLLLPRLMSGKLEVK